MQKKDKSIKGYENQGLACLQQAGNLRPEI